jgi:RNA-directed DNA polymerase
MLFKIVPIGNLTSQFLANVYLDPLDHHMKERLKTHRYIRYMDDMAIFDGSKDRLKELRIAMEIYLAGHLALRVKESATFINQRSNGIPFLGMRIFPNLIRVKRENLKRSLDRIARRERQLARGEIGEDRYVRSVQSVLGHLGSSQTLALRVQRFMGSGS